MYAIRSYYGLMVLWLAVAGAVAASRSDKHINIAVLDRFLPRQLKLAKDALVHGFTAFICGVVAWYSLAFVRTSHEFGDLLLDGVPAWMLQAVLPVGFALIAWRYALFLLRDLRRITSYNVCYTKLLRGALSTTRSSATLPPSRKASRMTLARSDANASRSASVTVSLASRRSRRSVV